MKQQYEGWGFVAAGLVGMIIGIIAGWLLACVVFYFSGNAQLGAGVWGITGLISTIGFIIGEFQEQCKKGV